MGNLGGLEVVVILLVALVVLGPKKLPDAARQVGRALTELKRISGGFQKEMREAMQDPIVEAESRAKGARVVASDSPTKTADAAETDSTGTDATETDSTGTDATETDSTGTDATATDSAGTDATATDSAAADNTEVDSSQSAPTQHDTEAADDGTNTQTSTS